jgi:hypothetical protein
VSGSDIGEIIDYTAAVAARVQGVMLPNGSVAGVLSVAGAGQGVVDDPLRTGQKIAACGENPTEALQHWSELPDAPVITPDTQNGTIKVEWEIPMRLIMPRSDLATTRAVMLPFYDAYLRAFWTDRQLGGLANLSYISRFERSGDSDWAWLEMTLHVVEYVTY